MPDSIDRLQQNKNPPYTLGLYELRFYPPYESPTDVPSDAWWRGIRDQSGAQAEAYAWARVAMADEIIQGGFDETQIDR